MNTKLKEKRIEQNLTQIELAKKIHMPYESLKNYELERRFPKYKSAKRIAEALGVPIQEIFQEYE